MSNAELIAETKVLIADCRTYNFGMRQADRLAHVVAPLLVSALEASTVQVEITERERLIDGAARTLPGWNDNTEDGDLTAHWERVNESCRELVTPIVDAILAGFRAPAADGDSAQSRIDQHMQKIAHRVMDVFENAEEDTLADDIMQDVFEAIGLTESFGVESEEGAA